MPLQNVLIAGRWRPAASAGTFRAENPATREPLEGEYPVSAWPDCLDALNAATEAFDELSALPTERVAAFLDDFAARIEARKDEIVRMANLESALPASPRLADNELPRTTGQLRAAAAAAREGSWSLPTIDVKNNIRSMLGPIGPVAVFGPNNFPLAFNSASGGDFAAAIAAGCPVIAKANTSHPGTTRLLAEEAFAAVQATGLPAATVQLIYRTSHEDGAFLVANKRLGATAYTGSRHAGLTLKKAADAAGKPFYAELSSINPVVILPGALEERLDDIAGQFSTSCLMGTGQFCTNPGLVILLAGKQTDRLIAVLAEKFKAAPVGTLLSGGVAKSLAEGIDKLVKAGAEVLAGGTSGGGQGHSHANTLLKATGQQFLAAPEAMQTEAFGNESLLVVCEHLDEAAAVLDHLEGNLTGCIYSHTGGADDMAYGELAPLLRQKVGRLLNDKMPTGVAVSPAMNHGGPFPATGHPGFTAVGIPASLRRFGMLQCYDGVRPHRLPPALADKNPTGKLWRLIDGAWTTGDVGAK
jgi:alpha-ketoglutaric semialdehyde dehydrogenase